MNIIVTGDLHSGKSRVLRKSLALLKEDYCGIFCRPVVQAGEKVGYALTRTNSSKIQVFAHRNFKSELSFGEYKCDLRPFTWAADYLQQCLSKEANLVVIDEIGMIEKNVPVYIEAVVKLLDSPLGALLVVQRRAAYFWRLLESRTDCRHFETTRQNRDSLPLVLAQELHALLLKNKI